MTKRNWNTLAVTCFDLYDPPPTFPVGTKRVNLRGTEAEGGAIGVFMVWMAAHRTSNRTKQLASASLYSICKKWGGIQIERK